MTKRRPPLSVEQALGRIAGELPRGIEQMAELTSRSPSLVRKWGDPERREKISIDDAITLDLAYQAAGGLGAPLHEAYTARLELAGATRFADRIALGRVLVDVIRESSEAEAALALAALPDATPATRLTTRREVEEAIAALSRVLPLLAEDLPRQTGPPA